MTKETLAAMFHETYEHLAPAFGYVTRKSTRCNFSELPQKNKALMIAVCGTILNALQDKESPAIPQQPLCASGDAKLPPLPDCCVECLEESMKTDDNSCCAALRRHFTKR